MVGNKHFNSECVFWNLFLFNVNIKSEISPMLLETNAYKWKFKNNNYANQSGP